MNDDSTRDVFCDFCGLPVPGGRRRGRVSTAVGPAYCCSGCRFAASIMASEADDGSSRRTLLMIGLAVFFAMNVMVFSMALWSRDLYAEELQAAGPLADALHQVFRYLAFIFCLPVLFILGGPLAAGVWEALRRRVVTTDLLLLLGVSAAVAYSLCSVVAGEGQIYFDVATMILLFVTLGRWLEAQGKLRSGEALDGLARLLPDTVHVLRNDAIVDAPRESIVEGETLQIRPGERLAVDGQIVGGRGDIDEQTLTGEGRPVARGPGDMVYSGTLNVNGDLRIVVTAAAGAETISRMMDLVRKSRRARGHYQRLADRTAAWFVPVVAIVAIAAAWWHGRRDGLEAGILTGLAVTLIACPCALGLATPMALWISLGRAARGLVLFRNAQAIEQLANVRAVLFDKTGTLTTGETAVTAFVTEEQDDRTKGLAYAAQLAAASNHCLSASIRRFAEGRVNTYVEIDGVETRPGRGVEARCDKGGSISGSHERVWLGSQRWLQEARLQTSSNLLQAINEAGGDDAPLCCIGWAGHVRGVFVFREELRPEAHPAIDESKSIGLNVAVVTGDRRAHAAHLAAKLKVPVLAEQLPEDKVAAIQNTRRDFGPVAMVGDGINDAPALAASDVGIALSCGADLSRDCAAVCLLSEDLQRVPWAVELSRQTIRIIRQNLCWAFSYNIVGIGLAATGRLSPVFSAAAMVASSAFVISNSLRMNRFPEPRSVASHLNTHRVDTQARLANLTSRPISSDSGAKELHLQPTS